LLGGSYQSTKRYDQVIDGYGATSDALLKNLASFASRDMRNTSSEYKYAALFARISYNYKQKYIASFSGRRDGSSRFGPGRRFGNFGSIGVAWVASDEYFFKSLREAVSFFKIRLTYGATGNDGIGDYMYQERYRAVEVGDPYQGTIGYQTVGIFNEFYAWEVTKKLEVAADFGFLKDRINTTIGWYRNRSNNQLIGFPYPSIVGPGGAVANLPALIQNAGLEVTLATENINLKYFRWSTSVNFTLNRNKLIRYPNSEGSPYYTAVIGRPFYGEIHAFNSYGVDPKTGLYRFTDKTGNLTLDPSDSKDPLNGGYVSVITTPKFFGGISNTLEIKRFTLDFLFQFKKQIGRNPLSDFLRSPGFKSNVPVEFNNRWRKEGDHALIQKVYSIGMPEEYSRALGWLDLSNFSYTDASFVRLKNVSISYRLSEAFLKRMSISDMKVFLQGQNVFTITGYKGLDPETQSVTVLPPVRTLTVGLQVTL